MTAPVPALVGFSDGEVPTAAELLAMSENVEMLYRSVSGGLRPQRPILTLRITRENREIPSGEQTSVVWDEAEIDTDHMWSGIVGEYIRINTPGFYRLHFQCVGQPTTIVGEPAQLRASFRIDDQTSVAHESCALYTGSAAVANAITEVELARGQVVQCVVVHAGGTAIALDPEFGTCRFSAVYLAPSSLADVDPIADPDRPDEEEPGGGDGERPYFEAADWHWGQIPTSPVLDSQSASIVNQLKTGQHVLNLIEFGNTLRGPAGITGATPRYTVAMDEDDDWGPAFPGGSTVPIPNGTENHLPPGSDCHLAVADPTTNGVYSMWIARKSGGSWAAGWGGYTALNGDGRESTGGSTGSGISRYACVVRTSEIAAGVIPHALFFSTDMARPTEVRYPATKTDGSNDSGASATIPEGARVQLDPTINLDAIAGITPIEKIIGKALQTYGAYCGDNGGARMAILCEFADDADDGAGYPGAIYSNAGADGDYFNLTHIPWASLRVLKKWDGSA